MSFVHAWEENFARHGLKHPKSPHDTDMITKYRKAAGGGVGALQDDAPTHAFSRPTTVPRSLGKFLTLVTKQAVSNQVPPLQVKPAMTRTSQKGVAINLHRPEEGLSCRVGVEAEAEEGKSVSRNGDIRLAHMQSGRLCHTRQDGAPD